MIFILKQTWINFFESWKDIVSLQVKIVKISLKF